MVHTLYEFITFIFYFFNECTKLLLLYSGFANTTIIDDEPIKIKDVVPYDKKYLEEYNLLDEVVLTNEKIELLANNFIMELTPVGNVIMCYDSTKGSFQYYSDNVVPYRFLETISRKYVITFACKSLFVNMSEELLDDTPEEKHKPKVKTKDMFASLKNPPTKKQQPLKMMKVNANRYSSMGRFSNFKIIKPVDKKLVVENYTMTFSDFKKLNANKTSL